MSADTLEIVKSEIGRLLGLDGHTDPNETNGEYAPFLTGDGLRGFRLYPINKAFFPGADYKISSPIIYNDLYDDFVGFAIDSSKWNAVHGTDGSAAVAINVQNNGVVRLTSGAGSTHTPAVNGAEIVSAPNMLISDGSTRMETRLGALSAATSQSIFFGLCDSSSLSAPFTLAAGTVTANATNGVGFLQDAAGTNTNLNLVAVNAGGSPQVVAISNPVSTTGFHTYRVTVDGAGNATFYIDYVKVGSIALAVATTALLGSAVEMYSEATSASQHLDVDYILAQTLSARA